MNVAAIRPHGVRKSKDHFVAHGGEVTLLKWFGNESHYEGRIMAHKVSTDMTATFPKDECSLSHAKWGFP